MFDFEEIFAVLVVDVGWRSRSKAHGAPGVVTKFHIVGPAFGSCQLGFIK